MTFYLIYLLTFAVTPGKEHRIVGKLMNRKLEKNVQGISLGDQDTKENNKHLRIISFELVASRIPFRHVST